MQPERGGMHLLLRHRELTRTDVLVGVELNFLETNDLAVDLHVTVDAFDFCGDRRLLELAQWLYLRVIDGVGVIVTVDTLHVSLALLEIETFDVELLRLMKIDCFLVKGRHGGRIGNLADNLRFSGDVDDDEVVARHGAQTYCVGGGGVGSSVAGNAGKGQQPRSGAKN